MKRLREIPILKSKLGVVYHYTDQEGLWDAIRKEYKGPLVIAKDLTTMTIYHHVQERRTSQKRVPGVAWGYEIKI
jgi:hypothetical protein